MGELISVKGIEEKYNSSYRWKREGIKLWMAGASDPLPRGVIWGFTKVFDDEEGKLVLRAVKEMSKVTPRLTWLVYDEGGLTKGKELMVERGVVIGARPKEL